MPTTPRVTVSVVSHGQRKMVASLLVQLAGLEDADLGRVVVTHNLPDDSLEKPAYAEYELIQIHNANVLGFSENHNRAFMHCETPWFAVLNPDIDFQFGNPFPALLAAGVAEAGLGAVAPALVQPTTGLVEPNRGVVTPRELICRRLPGWHPPPEPGWLVGAFLLIRSDVYRALNGFDERFRLYCEDVDLGLRIRRAGWTIRRMELVKVIHATQRHSRRNVKYATMHLVSLLRFWMKILLVRS